MSLNNTPAANRLHIVLFGKRNSGKSSLINALTGQDTALVSDIPGTTTDAVSKAMDDMRSDAKRSIRNLVDLGLLFSKSENQKQFFGKMINH